jgi:hypothetical protein
LVVSIMKYPSAMVEQVENVFVQVGEVFGERAVNQPYLLQTRMCPLGLFHMALPGGPVCTRVQTAIFGDWRK